MTKLFKFISEKDVSGFTLILPSVSVGNVGQLAVDLLISSLHPEKWATAWHAAFIPSVGSDAYGFGSPASPFSSSCELYIHAEKKLVIMQIRTPIRKEERGNFLKDLRQWVKECKLSQVVVIGSLSAHVRHGLELQEQGAAASLRYITGPATAQPDKDQFKTRQWREVERLPSLPSMATPPAEATDYYMPGGGFSKQFFKLCCEENLPITCVLKFCDEGNNAPDAHILINHLNSWLHLVADETSWTPPPSWNLLFGSPPPKLLF